MGPVVFWENFRSGKLLYRVLHDKLQKLSGKGKMKER